MKCPLCRLSFEPLVVDRKRALSSARSLLPLRGVKTIGDQVARTPGAVLSKGKALQRMLAGSHGTLGKLERIRGKAVVRGNGTGYGTPGRGHVAAIEICTQPNIFS